MQQDFRPGAASGATPAASTFAFDVPHEAVAPCAAEAPAETSATSPASEATAPGPLALAVMHALPGIACAPAGRPGRDADPSITPDTAADFHVNWNFSNAAGDPTEGFMFFSGFVNPLIGAAQIEADGEADGLTLPFDAAGGAQGDDDDAEWREFLALGTPVDATTWAGVPDWQHRPVLLSF